MVEEMYVRKVNSQFFSIGARVIKESVAVQDFLCIIYCGDHELEYAIGFFLGAFKWCRKKPIFKRFWEQGLVVLERDGNIVTDKGEKIHKINAQDFKEILKEI